MLSPKPSSPATFSNARDTLTSDSLLCQSPSMVRPFSPLSFRRCSSASVRNLPPPRTPQGARARPFDGREMISLCHDGIQLVNRYLRNEPWGEYHVRRNAPGHSKSLGRRQRGFYHCIEHIHWLVLLSMQECQKSPINYHQQHEYMQIVVCKAY